MQSMKVPRSTARSGKWILHLLVVACFLSIGTAGDPPRFVEKPPNSKIARQGQSLLLKCRATGRPRPFITWRKDGVLLRDGQNGILLSAGDLAVTSLTTSHRGRYTCRAQSVEGRIESPTTVYVEAPPEFTEKPANITTEEGKDAMFTCKATGYPSRMKFSWTYNGVPVGESAAVSGRNSVFQDGTLIIYNVNPSDKGIVTCRVDNGFGLSPTASAALYVQFKARVSQMPAVVRAGLGLRAFLHCPSEAEPPVNKVVWRKDGHQVSPQQNPRISLNANGSLILASASPRDAGQYTCTPYNILGTLGESTRSRLIIRDPPYFTHIPRPTYEGEIGKSLTIPCKGDGDPPPAVSWRKKLSNGESIEYRVEYGNLTIPYITKEVHGTWECVLTNSVAAVTKDVKILVKYTSPHQVSNVTAQALGNTAVRVSWTPGYNGGHPQRFMLWYKQAHKGDHSWETSHVENGHTVAVVEDLLPDTAYELAVLPENRIRSGPFSDTVIVRTLAAKPPVQSKTPALLSPPQALFASQTDEGYMQLSWRKPRINQAHQKKKTHRGDPPSPFYSNFRILGFLVEYRWTALDPATPINDPTSNPGSRPRRSIRPDWRRLPRWRRSAGLGQGRSLSRSKRSAESKLPEKNQWKTLTTTYENVTTIVIKPGKVYRDLAYDFRVLTVSENEYSIPSNPVSVSTKGWVAYPCYTGEIPSAALFAHPIVAGVLTAVCLVALLVIIGIICICKRRRRRAKDKKQGAENVVDQAPQSIHPKDGDSKHKMNGKLVGNDYPTVVDLTDGGPGVYGTMEKREFETVGSDGDTKTPFVDNNNKILENSKNDPLSSFLERKNADWKEDAQKNKERSNSDRSSVRLRRETAARILSEQFKRRSLTDHLRNSVRKDIPLRGGVRSASTSPERSKNAQFERPDRLNVTAPAALSAPGRRKIRLYSRPIDDPSCTQQRHMIIIKRKSQKSSSSEAARKSSSNRAPPSDSSESPVFGVVGTINQSRDERPGNSGPRIPAGPKNPMNSMGGGNSTSQQNSVGDSRLKDVFSPTHSSPVDDDVFNGLSHKCDDVIMPRGAEASDESFSPWMSPNSQPMSTSSPKESSPDVSPNRVVARHTVEYDPAHDTRVAPRAQQYDLYSPDSSAQWGFPDQTKTNSLTRNKGDAARYSRRPPESSRTSYTYTPYGVSPNVGYRERYDTGRDPYTHRNRPNQSSAIYQNNPNFRRLSLSHHPLTPPATQYQPDPGVHNGSRSRASFTFGHRPLTLLTSPRDVYTVQPYERPMRRPPARGGQPDPHEPPSTFEIDCSNSDIEVRFVKDPNGDGYVQAPPQGAPQGFMTPQREGRGEMVNRSHYETSPPPGNRSYNIGQARPPQATTRMEHPSDPMGTTSPSSGQHTADPRNRSSKPATQCMRPNSTSPVKQRSERGREETRSVARSGTAGETVRPSKAVRPRHLLSPSRLSSSSPLRNSNVKPNSGLDPPTSPPLGAVGSSDYGSQDTSNSSASPTTQAKNTTSPLHNRILGTPQERPPRRDNSSVEDNYEWDSEIAMESEILEALRHFGALKKTGPVSEELLDELNKFTKETKNLMQRQRQQSADVSGTNSPQEAVTDETNASEATKSDPASELCYSKESIARRCAALRAEFLHYQQLQQLDENEMT